MDSLAELVRGTVAVEVRPQRVGDLLAAQLEARSEREHGRHGPGLRPPQRVFAHSLPVDRRAESSAQLDAQTSR